jgi:hypothetical protein
MGNLNFSNNSNEVKTIPIEILGIKKNEKSMK